MGLDDGRNGRQRRSIRPVSVSFLEEMRGGFAAGLSFSMLGESVSM